MLLRFEEHIPSLTFNCKLLLRFILTFQNSFEQYIYKVKFVLYYNLPFLSVHCNYNV